MLADRTTLSIIETLTVCLAGISVVIFELALLAVMVWLLSRAVRSFERKPAKAPAETPAAVINEPEAAVQTAPVQITPVFTPNEVVLTDTDEQTAAMIMAIVSDETDIPLDHLAFKSIKLVEE
ncbi:MAG: OadG family protein [Clostridiales bacterium]|nr:OadG family protein [Clostridiales bacterium]